MYPLPLEVQKRMRVAVSLAGVVRTGEQPVCKFPLGPLGEIRFSFRAGGAEEFGRGCDDFSPGEQSF